MYITYNHTQPTITHNTPPPPYTHTEPAASEKPEEALQQGYQIQLTLAGIGSADLHKQFEALGARYPYAHPDQVQRYMNGHNGDCTAGYQALLESCMWREQSGLEDITNR